MLVDSPVMDLEPDLGVCKQADFQHLDNVLRKNDISSEPGPAGRGAMSPRD